MAHTFNQTQYKSPVVWKQSSNGQVPSDGPVVGGTEINGDSLYVGRAIQDGDCIPGKVSPIHGSCFVAHGGAEHRHREYQVMTNPDGTNLEWVSASDGEVPMGAIQGGEQSDGQKLFIGRAQYNGSLIIGKVHTGHRTLYVSFDGEEVALNVYEVLVCRDVCP